MSTGAQIVYITNGCGKVQHLEEIDVDTEGKKMELVDKKVAIETVGLNTWAGSRISSLPTVEAIPVEWVEKRMKEINEAMTHLYVEGCFYPKDDDYEERKNILLRRLAEIKLHGPAYDLVLNEWRIEKENEPDRYR